MNLKQTKWYRWVKNNWPECFHKEILELAQNSNTIYEIEKWEPRTLGNITDEVFWAISVVKPDSKHGRWMYEAKTEEEALALCKEMTWRMYEIKS